MAFGYRYKLERQQNGWWLVRFPGIPEALTEGETEDEARQRTRHAGKLGAAIARPTPQLAHVDHRRSAQQDERGAVDRPAQAAVTPQGRIDRGSALPDFVCGASEQPHLGIIGTKDLLDAFARN